MGNYGVKVIKGHKVDTEELAAQQADVVFVAAGSKARTFQIQGAEQGHVHYAHEVFYDKEKLGESAAVIGGVYLKENLGIISACLKLAL